MLHNVYLEGEMGEKFGKEFKLSGTNFKDIIKCLDCNFDGQVRKYIIDCAEKGVDFACKVADEYIGEEEVLLSMQPGDIIITPVPAGSKSGATKILAAVAIAAFVWWNPLGWATFGATGGFAGLGTGGLMALGVATNLALTGIQQIMAPDPSTDNRQGEDTYLFNGSEQNIIEGDPVPILYGELRIPGRPISFEILNEEFRNYSGQGISLDIDYNYTVSI